MFFVILGLADSYTLIGGVVPILGLVLLGLVQGLCEFLPVSSSGHLVLLSQVLGLDDSLFVSIILHVATLLAIIVVLRKDVFNMVRHPFSKDSMMLYVATIPTCLIVLVIMPLVNESFNGGFLAISFLISALLLIFVQYYGKRKKSNDFSFKHAIIMGVAQGFAVFPGVSRSGTTISAGLLSGGERSKCAKFSFLMSIPIILLSLVLEIVKIFIYHQPISVNILGLILAFLVAFLVGILSIKLMLKITERANFKWFSSYLVVIAIVSILI